MEERLESDGVEELEKHHVALSKGESLEEKQGVGGEGEREKRKEVDELTEVDERPERLHRVLTEVRETYRQIWEEAEPTARERELTSEKVSIPKMKAEREGWTNSKGGRETQSEIAEGRKSLEERAEMWVVDREA